jgi:xylulokinase
LYALNATDYCAAALAATGIARSALADIQKPGQPIAQVLPASAAAWELTSDTLVVTGTSDQCAAALGMANCRPGILSVNTGTCLALLTLADELPRPMPVGLFGGAFAIPGHQYALAFSKTAGVVLEWFKRELRPDRNFRELDEMASSVPVGSHGVIMLPHFDGMVSPVPDPNARGAFLNLSLRHTCADMYRATLEALGYTLNECVQLLRRSGFDANSIRAAGGMAKSNLWLQLIADITGLPVERPVIVEAGVVGAAAIAAFGSGAFPSLEESSKKFYQRQQIYTPNPENHVRYEKLCDAYGRLYRQIYRPCSGGEERTVPSEAKSWL